MGRPCGWAVGPRENAAAVALRRGLSSRPSAQDLKDWVEGLSEEQLLLALTRERREERQVAAIELCQRDPDRSVEAIVTALRHAAGRQEERYEPPDAAELVDLGLHSCRCKGLRRVELFTDVLSDEQAAKKLRRAAVWGLMPEDDPRAWEALRAAAAGPNPRLRLHAKQVLNVKETLQELPPYVSERVFGKDT